MIHMPCLRYFALLAVILSTPVLAEDVKTPVKIACVGDSIPAGVGTKDISHDAYPAQLARLLGDKYDVHNFGVSGATLLNKGDKPYQKEPAFHQALDLKPDVVVIMLGTNDTKPQNWKFKDEFSADYKDLAGQFASLRGKPKIYVCYPVDVPGAGNFGINDAGLKEEMPMIGSLAKGMGLTIIDLHTPFVGKPKLLPDRVHPNTEGATLMAKTVFEGLTDRAGGANK